MKKERLRIKLNLIRLIRIHVFEIIGLNNYCEFAN